jgi:hypothetical protein
MGNEYETVHDDDYKECIHHWLIDVRNFGVCKKCGESKHFCSTWSAASIHNAWHRRSGKVQHSVVGIKAD